MFNFFKKKGDSSNNGPDFSAIDSNEKAKQLFEKGDLKKLYLMPLEFGGKDNPMNYLYTQEFAVEFKNRFDAMVENMLVEGKDLSYSASPEYKGTSFIPSKINISVSGDATLSETINIW